MMNTLAAIGSPTWTLPKAPTAASGGDTFTPSVETPAVPTRQEILRAVLSGSGPDVVQGVRWHREFPYGISKAVVSPDGSVACRSYSNLHIAAPGGGIKTVPDLQVTADPLYTPEGNLVVSCRDGLRCLDKDGAELWHAPVGSAQTAPARDQEGNLYVGVKAKTGTALASVDKDGTPRFSTDLSAILGRAPQAEMAGGPSVSPDGRVYCFANLGPLVCVDGQSGDVQWFRDYDGGFARTGAPDARELAPLTAPLQGGGVGFTPDGHVLAATGPGRNHQHLLCLSPTGEVVFEHNADFGKPTTKLSADELSRLKNQGVRSAAVSSATPITSPDGQTIYFAGDGSLRAVDRQGHQRWQGKLPTGDNRKGNEVKLRSDGNLIVSSSNGMSVWTPGGDLQWTFEPNRGRTADQTHLDMGQGELVVSSYQGGVWSLDEMSLSDKMKKLSALPAETGETSIAVQNGSVTIGHVRVRTRKR